MAGEIIDYNDQRLTDVEREGAQRKQEVTNNYNQMINERDAYTQQQQQNVNNWAQQQTELQQAKTDQAINRINQSKEQGAKDYTREQKGAYTDYMKQSNQYGANAEMMARQGMSNSGYSESSQVSMWNAYQNRYAPARESYQKAVTEWDNMMKDAELSNNETMANIAQQKLEQSLKLALEGFEYKNNLTIQRDSRIDEIENYYNNKYNEVLAQINREYEYAQQQKQYEEEQRRWLAEFEEQQKQAEREYQQKLRDFDLRQQQIRDQNAQWEKEYALKKASTQAQIANLKAKSSSYGGYGLTGDTQTQKQQKGLTENAKNVYKEYLAAKQLPILKKTLTLENFLTQQLNSGKIDKDDMTNIIYTYGG